MPVGDRQALAERMLRADIQHGRSTAVTDGNGRAKITMPRAYPDTSYTIILTAQNSGARYCNVYSRTASYFWIGYWNEFGDAQTNTTLDLSWLTLR